MKHQKIYKDLRLRVTTNRRILGCILWRTLRMTPHLSKYTLRKVYSKIFHHFPRLAPRNYCQLTLKSRVISSKFGLSRHTYKKQGNEGLLYGVQKASW